MRIALLLDVLRRPVWLFGLLTMVLAFGFQAAALGSGELSLVQPLLLAELPMTLLIAKFWFKAPIERRAWLGVAGMCLGVAAVLVAAEPRGGAEQASLRSMIFAAAAMCVLIGVLITVALRMEGSARAATFGAAAGAGFALTAALMKGATSELTRHGVAAVFSSWEVYAMAAGGVASLFIWQNALQSGTLAAAQPAITFADPVLATVIGVVVFGERVRLGGWLPLEVAGAVAVVAGSIELARSPLVSGESQPTQSAPQPPREAVQHPRVTRHARRRPSAAARDGAGRPAAPRRHAGRCHSRRSRSARARPFERHPRGRARAGAQR